MTNKQIISLILSIFLILNQTLYATTTIQTNTHNPISNTPPVTYNANSNTIIDNLTLPKGKYGTFLVNKASNHPYLIEANPLYANYNTFISSDYMLSKLDYRPEKTLKRLGDAMYETQLVSNSVIRLRSIGVRAKLFELNF